MLVKVVQSGDAWEIAEAANFQNEVNDIDLKLAQYMRWQLFQKAAALSGYKTDSATQIVDEIYDRRATYEETRLLYIGIFSQSPVNIFRGNYTSLNYRLMNEFRMRESQVFELLFTLQNIIQRDINEAKSTLSHKSYANKIDRIDSPQYRCFLGILALCGALDIDISNFDEDSIESKSKKKQDPLDAKKREMLLRQIDGRFHLKESHIAP